MNDKPPAKPANKKQAEVLDLSSAARRKKARSKVQKAKARGTTLCSRGFHKWVDDPKKQFDVKAGKLVSIRRCKRCGLSKTHVS